MRPLKDIRILDFSAQLPGPLASLILTEAGAEVIRIEPPVTGDMLRSYPPLVDGESVNFAMLNAGKRSIAIDLKLPGAAEKLFPLVRQADVVIEQFRPGVMERLGVGYETLRAVKPDLIFCSISGYGQNGPKSALAGHDLNYCADTGLLAMAGGSDGAPFVPAALVADIAGGAYPAVMNILLALRHRDATGQGSRIDVSMSDNLFVFMYWASARGFATGAWPKPSEDILTGGSPRYAIYPTRDGRHLAVAALEEKFWINFCQLIGLGLIYRNDIGREDQTRAEVARIIASEDSSHWRNLFEGTDTCCTVVARLDEAVRDLHYVSRGLLDGRLQLHGTTVPALPVPISRNWAGDRVLRSYPALGEANDEFLGPNGSR